MKTEEANKLPDPAIAQLAYAANKSKIEALAKHFSVLAKFTNTASGLPLDLRSQAQRDAYRRVHHLKTKGLYVEKGKKERATIFIAE